ncbi:helix-turn-helix domain-containing protein [Odoribacter lunatus]|uniref:helix-turn-helix domain-containing protein n=1 Tax=Odoribacter lunatus TaxID=2941335 RepID=UPI00203C7B62|nr:helix-turn-helix transcriptional regulator [Odoribacter lunatus]
MKDRLNQLIEEKGLTATKFATLIDANPSAISHLLKGRNKPGYDLLVNIAKAFPDISMDWLLTGNGEMYQTKKKDKDSTIKKEYNEPQQPYKQIVSPPIIQQQSHASINSGKELKRIVLFFSDGSFEDYLK